MWGLGLGECPAGGLPGFVVVAADGRMPFKTTHVDRTAADATLTRECDRIHQAQRDGTITSADAARLIEAAHARRDAEVQPRSAT
jgi:hypothetical protein